MPPCVRKCLHRFRDQAMDGDSAISLRIQRVTIKFNNGSDYKIQTEGICLSSAAKQTPPINMGSHAIFCSIGFHPTRPSSRHRP